MEHGLELIIPRLEILEIAVCNILQNPGNIGKRIFVDSVLSWNYWKTDFLEFLISWKYWKTDFSTSSHPGNIGSYDPHSVLSWK